MSRNYNEINVNGHMVPATFHDGVKKMLAQIELGRVPPTTNISYSKKLRGGSASYCAIGSMLSEDQLAYLTMKREKTTTWNLLADTIGRQNAQVVLGMHVQDARNIQIVYDTFGLTYVDCQGEKGLIAYLTGLLERSNYDNPGLLHEA
jgi:hypothetical protein